jgi:hypothetical protein
MLMLQFIGKYVFDQNYFKSRTSLFFSGLSCVNEYIVLPYPEESGIKK